MNEAQAAALVEKFNVVTSKVADKIRRLEDERTSSGLTDARENELHTQMLAIADVLDTVGSDPANPVPDVPA
jgi:hypothetical protein